MKAIDVDTIDWADGCFFDTDGTPLPIHHKIATIEMLRDWQPSCEEEIRADEREKTIEEYARRLNLMFVELPLDDLILLNIFKEINRIANQIKEQKNDR